MAVFVLIREETGTPLAALRQTSIRYFKSFASETTIKFWLPADMEATLTVWETTGKLLVRQTGVFTQGDNTMMLETAGLGAGQLLFYRLETPLAAMTRQMVRI